MQAEHIPVHLGAMPAAVEAVAGAEHGPGRRAWILNDPYAGGTHLPDITVVTPVFTAATGAAARLRRQPRAPRRRRRRHPGSMPADSTTLAEEGVVIAPRRLDEAADDELVAQMRQPAQRRADLRAQLAANRTGASACASCAPRRARAPPRDEVDYAERRMRACLAALRTGRATASDVLEAREGDLELRLAATSRRRATLDFTGSAPQHAGNLNCPLAVTRSAPAVRPARAHRPRHPAERRRLAHRSTVIAPEGSLLNARSARRGRRRQRRDVEPRRRPRARRVRPRARPGDDEQPHARHGRASRTTRRSAAARARAGRRRPERRARGDEQHAQHAGRGARARVPAARDALRHAPRLGRRGRAPRRRRRRARARGARRPMAFSLLTERRRHAPPGADGGGSRARRGRNLLDGEELPPKARADCARASGCASRRRAAAASAWLRTSAPRTTTEERAKNASTRGRTRRGGSGGGGDGTPAAGGPPTEAGNRRHPAAAGAAPPAAAAWPQGSASSTRIGGSRAGPGSCCRARAGPRPRHVLVELAQQVGPGPPSMRAATNAARPSSGGETPARPSLRGPFLNSTPNAGPSALPATSKICRETARAEPAQALQRHLTRGTLATSTISGTPATRGLAEHGGEDDDAHDRRLSRARTPTTWATSASFRGRPRASCPRPREQAVAAGCRARAQPASSTSTPPPREGLCAGPGEDGGG